MTNSTAPGFLQPTVPAPPLEGRALQEFLQRWVVGITELDGKLVRPRWQSEPPVMPDKGVPWCAIGITSRPYADAFPYVEHRAAGDGSDVLVRNQHLEMLLSFYDDGISGQADFYCQKFIDGCAIQQNRDYLLSGGFLLRAVPGEMLPVPSLFSTTWFYRVDTRADLARQIDREYAVFNLTTGRILLYEDDGPSPQPQVINVEPTQ